MVKGRALARPRERSERFEPLVRLGLPDAVVRTVQNEKAGDAELKAMRGKFNVLLSAIVLPCVLQRSLDVVYATRCGRRSVVFEAKKPEAA